jgi:hypothetical protein
MHANDVSDRFIQMRIHFGPRYVAITHSDDVSYLIPVKLVTSLLKNLL